MSLQSEKSEPAESEDRRLRSFSSIRAVESSSLAWEVEARVRRGMVKSLGFEEGMMPVVGGLAGKQPV